MKNVNFSTHRCLLLYAYFMLFGIILSKSILIICTKDKYAAILDYFKIKY